MIMAAVFQQLRGGEGEGEEQREVRGKGEWEGGESEREGRVRGRGEWAGGERGGEVREGGE